MLRILPLARIDCVHMIRNQKLIGIAIPLCLDAKQRELAV